MDPSTAAAWLRRLHRDGRCRRIAYRPDLCRDCAEPAPDRAHNGEERRL